MQGAFWEEVINSLQKKMEDDIIRGKREEELIDKYSKMDINDIIQDNIVIAAELNVNYLEKTMQEEITKMEDYTVNFNKHFLELYEESYNASLMLYKLAATIILDYCSDLLVDDIKFSTIKEIATRACQEYLEIISLVKNGFPDGAWARWRSLYELSIISQFIFENNNSIANNFYISANDANNYEWARESEKFKDYRKDWKITFKSILRRCSRRSDKSYKFYLSANKAVHATAEGTFGRLGVVDGVGSAIGRSLYGARQSAFFSAVELNEILRKILSYTSDFDNLILSTTLQMWINKIEILYNQSEAKLEESFKS